MGLRQECSPQVLERHVQLVHRQGEAQTHEGDSRTDGNLGQPVNYYDIAKSVLRTAASLDHRIDSWFAGFDNGTEAPHLYVGQGFREQDLAAGGSGSRVRPLQQAECVPHHARRHRRLLRPPTDLVLPDHVISTFRRYAVEQPFSLAFEHYSGMRPRRRSTTSVPPTALPRPGWSRNGWNRTWTRSSPASSSARLPRLGAGRVIPGATCGAWPTFDALGSPSTGRRFRELLHPVPGRPAGYRMRRR